MLRLSTSQRCSDVRSSLVLSNPAVSTSRMLGGKSQCVFGQSIEMSSECPHVNDGRGQQVGVKAAERHACTSQTLLYSIGG